MYLRFIEAMRVLLEKLAQVTQWAVSESPISASGRGGSSAEVVSAAFGETKNVMLICYNNKNMSYQNRVLS